MIAWTKIVASGLAAVVIGAIPARAQSLGAFTWQLQPFCNKVTVTVTQNGAIYTMDGYDEQCGAGQRAPVVGIAAPNPDGSIGFGWTIVTVPGGKPVHIDARIDLATIGGTWSDSAGNTGALVLNGQAAGSPRPAPSAPGIAPGSVASAALAPGAVTAPALGAGAVTSAAMASGAVTSSALAAGAVGAAHLAANAVTSAAIANGSVGAADVDLTQVQRRIANVCPIGSYVSSVSQIGNASCTSGVGLVTALGFGAGAASTPSAQRNTAIGFRALFLDTSGFDSTAVGTEALTNYNRAGQSENTAIGSAAMFAHTTGLSNTAVGAVALAANTAGAYNTAIGRGALQTNVLGSSNIAVGYGALSAALGGSNIGIGMNAGFLMVNGNQNIYIGNDGHAADNFTMRIGGIQTRAFMAGIRGVTTATAAIPVLVGTDGQLGTVSSSRRYKEDIAEMGELSARLFKLRPVTFRYTQPAADGMKPLDFGLIAEEVADVFPELAVRGIDGQIETVAYHKLPALLLNELQRQQATIDRQATAITALETRLATIEATTVAVKH